MTDARATGGLEAALNRLKIADDTTEVYPEAYDKPKRFKKVFSSNSTFVTFTHLIRAMMGPTILAVPGGFRLGGLAFAPIGFFAILVLATYNMRRVILNAAFLSQRENVSVRTFDEVAFLAFDTCSPRTKAYAKPLKIFINMLFFVTYLDACVIFMIFISRNLEAIINFYFPHNFIDVRYFIFFQVGVLMCLSTIRELKHLSPFSLIASILLVTVLVILVLFYFCRPPGNIKDRDLVTSPSSTTHFICVVLFCLSGISIALTLKSSMKNPEHFMSFPGIFYISVTGIGFMFTSFGFLGYLKYGYKTEPSVLLNVPFDGPLSVCVKVFAIISVLFTCPLVFYVAFNVLWNNFLKQFFCHFDVVFSEYTIRFCLIILCFIIAVAFPDLGKMIVLKGAIFHSHLEVTIPPILDYVTNYPEQGTGKYHYRLLSLIILILVGVGFCVGGIIVGIRDWTEES